MIAPFFLVRHDRAGIGDARRVSVPAGLDLVWSHPTAQVWARPDTTLPVGQSGVVIGHLFMRRSAPRRVAGFSTEEAARIVASGGASLLRDYWGGYVAILATDRGGLLVLRDPSGTLPAYWRRQGGLIWIAPELGIAPFTRADGLRFDPEALAAHLHVPNSSGSRTCIIGVEEIRPGRVLRLGSGEPLSSTLWSPWEHVIGSDKDRMPDPDALREVVLGTIGAWGSCFPKITLGLSGGLDSTIVATGLARSGALVQGLTMVGPGADGDERGFAAQAAHATCARWQWRPYRLEDVDITAPVVGHVPRPFLSHYVQAIVQTRKRLAERTPVDAWFSGNGGDNVFCLMRSVTPVLDRLLARSHSRDILASLHDVAQLTGADWLSILSTLVTRMVRRRKRSSDPSFLAPAMLARLDHMTREAMSSPPHGVLPGQVVSTEPRI